MALYANDYQARSSTGWKHLALLTQSSVGEELSVLRRVRGELKAITSLQLTTDLLKQCFQPAEPDRMLVGGPHERVGGEHADEVSLRHWGGAAVEHGGGRRPRGFSSDCQKVAVRVRLCERSTVLLEQVWGEWRW